MEVLKSNDYKKFKAFPYNRDINQKRVMTLAKSIWEHGFLLPLLVTKKNMIIDGQHRYEAAKNVGCEFSYVVIDVPDEKIPILMAKVNSTSKVWTMAEYLDLWAGVGKESYIYIKNVIIECGINISIFMRMFKNSDTFIASFKCGKLDLSEQFKERVSARLLMLKHVLSVYESEKDLINSIALKSAISRVIVHPEYDHTRMMKKLSVVPGKIKKASSVAEYTIMIESIYNFHAKNTVTFSKG